MKKSKHDEGLDYIVKNPELITYKPPILVAKEPHLYDRVRDGRILPPDAIMFDGRYYIVEFKSNDGLRCIRKARDQLNKYQKVLRQNMGIEAEKVFAYYDANGEIQVRRGF